MKKLTQLLAMLLISNCIYAQNSKVPENVTKAFAKKYPDIKKVEWEYDEEDAEWEAEFKVDKKEYEADFDSDGKWLETECEIEARELPKVILDKVKSENQSSGASIKEIERIETAKGVFYEVESEAEETMKDPKTGKDVAVSFKSSYLFSEDGEIMEDRAVDDEGDDTE